MAMTHMPTKPSGHLHYSSLSPKRDMGTHKKEKDVSGLSTQKGPSMGDSDAVCLF